MACATLKRSLDWDSLNQRPNKRRRYNPIGSSEKSHSRTLTSGSLLLGTENIYSPHASIGNFVKEKKSSVFKNSEIEEASAEKMAAKIREEIKRLHKRKELFLSSFGERMQDSESSGSEMGADSPRRPESPGAVVRNPEKALFTFKQVQLICERMLKEKEDEMREKYDGILTIKLAEQYDAFVKFTYDQIQRRYEAAPSYLS